MLLDCFRLTATTEVETEKNTIEYLKQKKGGFNYNRAAKGTRMAYDGYELEPLYRQFSLGNASVAKTHNLKVLKITAPLATGRKIQTFDIKKRKFIITPTIQANLGPQFFFVENDVVKLAYIHARNNHRASLVHLAGLAWGMKTEILDDDFYDQPSDVEFLDVDKRDDQSIVKSYTLSELETYLHEDPMETLSRFARVFTKIRNNGLAGEIIKPHRRPREDKSPNHELFD